jgi:hypothetical protein
MGTIVGLVVAVLVASGLAVGAAEFVVSSQEQTPANSAPIEQPFIPPYGAR